MRKRKLLTHKNCKINYNEKGSYMWMSYVAANNNITSITGNKNFW